MTRLPWSARQAPRLQNVVRCALAVRRRVRAGGCDVLQVGTLRPLGPVGAWLHRLEGIPFVLYVHGNDVLKETRKARRSALYRAGARDVLRRASAVIANSGFTARLVAELGAAAGVPDVGSRTHVVHPGADPERFRPDHPGAAALRARWSLGSSRVALTVARLEPRKGVALALEAIGTLVRDFPDLVYVVAGEGPQRRELEEQIAAGNLATRVRLVGAVADADLPALYALADLFILPVARPQPDDVEGFGIVLCEAAASRLPVVACRSGGVAEAVRDGETALLVDPENPGALEAALRRVLEEPDLAHRLGSAGRAAVLDYFNWERAARQAWEVVESAARRPARS